MKIKNFFDEVEHNSLYDFSIFVFSEQYFNLFLLNVLEEKEKNSHIFIPKKRNMKNRHEPTTLDEFYRQINRKALGNFIVPNDIFKRLDKPIWWTLFTDFISPIQCSVFLSYDGSEKNGFNHYGDSYLNFRREYTADEVKDISNGLARHLIAEYGHLF
ncbi:hypothetical protein HYW74_05000 [Candidatus Pacearchaeota archaeon]|nr:hypothetical protein [Candidatus Pacearchaeota archaeon]